MGHIDNKVIYITEDGQLLAHVRTCFTNVFSFKILSAKHKIQYPILIYHEIYKWIFVELL